MKIIGLIGGMSWESTVTYYQHINRLAREHLGELHSARILLWSFDFAQIEALQAADDWAAATQLMTEAAQNLEKGGAECLAICTNTMHKMSADVESAVDIPLVHIADATAAAIKPSAATRPLLLATRYTMEQDFYTGRLKDIHNIDVFIPERNDREMVHDVIYRELCQGVINPDSKSKYIELVERYSEDGTDGVILGCTEISLLVDQSDFSMPAFDTTALHARAILQEALD